MRFKDEEDLGKSKRSGLSIGWVPLSLSLGILAFAAIATLTIIVTTKGTDVLSTVALLLAILSFSAQLIVTATQAHSADQQYRDLSILAGKTKRTLNRLDERTNGILEAQKGTFERLFESVLDRGLNTETVAGALAEAASSESDSDDDDNDREPPSADQMAQLAAVLTTRIRDDLKRTIVEEVENASTRRPNISAVKRNPSRLARADEALIRLLTADPSAIREFIEISERSTQGRLARRVGVFPFGEAPEWAQELSRVGLVRIASGTNADSGETFTSVSLNESGSAARMALTLDPMSLPETIARLVDRVRGKAGIR